MTVIAVIQQKGGVGKSTIAANLAGELVFAKKRVVLFDLDPQQSLIQWARIGRGGLLRELILAAEIDAEKRQAFRAAVEQAKGRADYVLLDGPPGFTDAGITAALVADVALLPVTPSPLDFLAAKQAVELIREAHKQRGEPKPVIAFVPSRVIQQTTLGRNLPENLKVFGEVILPGISQRIAVAESALEGLTVREYLHDGGAVAEFQQLAKAVERMVNS